MKRVVLLLFALLMFIDFDVLAQTVSKEKQSKPKVDIKVNVKRDANGNIISYDSTYTEVYTNSNLNNIDVDSLISEFNKNFTSFGLTMNDFPMFPDFESIQKNMMDFPNINDFFNNSDSLFFGMPQMPDFSELEKFFENEAKSGKTQIQKNNNTNNKKPKLNPASTYSF